MASALPLRSLCKKLNGAVYRFLLGAKLFGDTSKARTDQCTLEKIRNIGIMAHIDAGKTTTTERMLYYAGFIKHVGDVDDGDTVMDYMRQVLLPQERERGITINSAAVTFHWKQHQLNLIDTPGHIDFTFEVERSLQVLDGAIAIFDASAGVESQTLSVWSQADRYNLPRIAFFNKMDKYNANFGEAVESMRTKLPHVIPLMIQYPVGFGKKFSGVVDLLSMDLLLWEGLSDQYRQCTLNSHCTNLKEFVDKNSSVTSQFRSSVTSSFLQDVYSARQHLTEQLAMLDDAIFEEVVSDSFHPFKIDKTLLETSLRKVTLQRKGVPVLFGSSLKNKGIQPLLDAVVSYLPSPQDRNLDIPKSLQQFLAFAFKVTHHKKRGPLVYLRIYSGSIKPNTSVYNVTQSKEERVSRVLLMLADEPREMVEMFEGNIAVISGLKYTVTGDVIVCSKKGVDNRSNDELPFRPPLIPQPMFFCSIEPESPAYQKDLDHALVCLSREDPSLRVSLNNETGQTILSGMGELHLEIVLDRIIQEYKIPAELGKLQVAYREAPTISVQKSDTLVSMYGTQTNEVTIELTLEPTDDTLPQSVLPNKSNIVYPVSLNYEDILKAIKNGIALACQRGPVLCYPVSQVKVTVHSVMIGLGTSLPAITSCTTNCVNKALRESEEQLLEPFMELSLTLPEGYLSVVMSDLAGSRRAQVLELNDNGDMKLISAHIPVASLAGYSTALRSLTSGTASFTAQFSHYEPVSKALERDILKQIRGY